MLRITLAVTISLGILALIAWLGVRETLTPLERDHVENPIYAVGEAIDPSVDLETSKIIIFGPAFWGQYPGARAFSTIAGAERYLIENNKAIDGWAIYQLSGDFALDTYLENGHPHLNKSLVVVRLVKKPGIFRKQDAPPMAPAGP